MHRTRKLGHRRTRHSVRTTCQVVRERDFKLVAEHTLNLSGSGMLVQVDDRILTGERLLVSFRIPRSRFWIDAEAVVARVVHGRRRGDRARAVGLCFEHLPGWQRLLLETRLRRIPVIPPADVRQAA